MQPSSGKRGGVRAIDTNIVVRYLTLDDGTQAKAARSTLEAGGIFISLTVCLETEWVLRSAYQYPAGRIATGLSIVTRLPGISVEQPMVVATAIEWMRTGMDFADALHLAMAEGCTAFISFDKKLAKTAEGLSSIPVQTP